jgi:ABC-type uncharacterized transport system permease subunit
LLATLLFAVAVLALRWFLERAPGGWVVLVLLPVVAFTGLLVGRVLAQMRRDRLRVDGLDVPADDGDAPPPPQA